MRTLILFLVLVVTAVTVCGQGRIYGKVVSAVNGAPLSSSSVYINNSTQGSVTDSAGLFVIEHVRPGRYELIVSHVGFETIVHPFSMDVKDLRFEFRLNEAPRLMRSIYIMSRDKRDMLLGLFRTQFLGQGFRADRCEILNEDDIMFSDGDSKGMFKAFADTPIVFLNRTLGYKVSFNLQDFYFDSVKGRSGFLGYAKYDELDIETKGKWAKARKDAYEGSTMHFFRSWYKGQLEENNFLIYGMFSTGNTVARKLTPIAGDSFLVRDVGGAPFALNWKGTIAVQYRKVPAGLGYLERKVPYMNNPPKGVESQLEMLNGPSYFSSNGLLMDPLSVRYSGYWAQEKMADMLPVDYDPAPSP